jgi:DNA-binding ferritin-like protein
MVQIDARSSVGEDEDEPTAGEMSRYLVKGQEAAVPTARAAFPAGKKAGARATIDRLTGRRPVSEEAAGMLRSLLE